MSDAWDEVKKATDALKAALDKAVQAGKDTAGGVTDLTKHVIDTTQKNIDKAVDWAKQQIGTGPSPPSAPTS